jgi:hypothetical protein
MTVDPSDLDGKPFALFLMAVDEKGEEDWAVFFGIARYEGEQLVIDRGKDAQPFVVRDEWMSRIRPVPAGTEDIFQSAKHFLGLTVSELPTGVDPAKEGYEFTGLKWDSTADPRSEDGA